MTVWYGAQKGDWRDDMEGMAVCCYRSKVSRRKKERRREKKRMEERKGGKQVTVTGGRMMEKKRSGQGRNEDVQGGKIWGKVSNGKCR